MAVIKGLISEEAFQALPQGFRDWVAKLGWEREEIDHITADPPVGHSRDISVSIQSKSRGRWLARFTRLDNGDWHLEEDHDITPFPGRDEVSE
jgi:hypothetical protein